MSDKPAYRPAIAADSRFIVDMIDIASDGVALVDWTQSAQEAGDQTALDIGVQRYASEQGDYSYRNCWLAEVAGVIGYMATISMPEAITPKPKAWLPLVTMYCCSPCVSCGGISKLKSSCSVANS